MTKHPYMARGVLPGMDQLVDMTNKGAITLNRQAICDVLNSLEVVEQEGGESAYISVEDNCENREKLYAMGITKESIDAVGDGYGETFDILALAFYDGKPFADDYEKGKFVVWESLVDDDLRYRVTNGQARQTDSERLLQALEPELFGGGIPWPNLTSNATGPMTYRWSIKI